MTSTTYCSIKKEDVAAILNELIVDNSFVLNKLPVVVDQLGALEPAYSRQLVAGALAAALGFSSIAAIFFKAKRMNWDDSTVPLPENVTVSADTFIEYISEANNHAINTLREYVKELESTPIAEVQTRDYINIWVSDPSKDIPKPGSIWQHRTKAVDYEVMYITNERSTDPDKWPVTVVYRETGKSANASVPIWSRPLVDWFKSMEATRRVVE